MNVSVTLSAPSGLEVTVPFTVSGTASGSDAAVSASPLVIPAGASGGVITVAVTNDSLYENAETVILTLGTPVNAVLGTASTHTLTVADDEGRPVLAFAAAASSAAENAGTASVAVALSGPSSSDISVPFTVSGTASASDATVSASPLVIPAGASGGVITVAVTNDSLHENAETVILTLGTPSGAGLGSAVRHTLTATDDDSPPAAAFAAAASSAGEAAGTVNVSVTLSAPSGLEVSVPFTVSGTASGSDATVSASPLVIPAGASGGVITVAVTNDSLHENAETVILTLGTPSGAGLGSAVQHTLTVTDDDATPAAAFAAAASSAGEAAGTVNVSVTLSAPSGLEVSVPFTVSGTASGSDATVSASPLVIPAGASGGVITVAVANDALYENAETVILTLGTPVNAVLGTASTHTLTVADDEGRPVLAFAAAASSAAENAGTASVAVALSGPSSSDISVPFTVSGTASGSDAAVSASPLVIPAGASGGVITVAVANDSLYENAETVILTLGTPVNAVLGTASTHTLTVADDEGRPVLAFAAAASSAAENAGTASVAVALSGPSSSDISVPFTVSGTASGSDATVSASPLVIPAGASGGVIAVAVANDSLHENAETVILTLGSPSGADLGSAVRHTLTVTDDDAQPAAAFAAAASSAGEAAGTVNVSVTLSAPSGLEVSVPFTMSGTASGSDAAVSASPLVIPAGAAGGSISIAIVNDALHENAETVILTPGTPVNAVLGTVATHTLTVTDDDAPPAVSLTAGGTLAENGGPVTVTVTLDAPSGLPVTVALATGGSAAKNADYEFSGSLVAIPAGGTDITFTVSPLNDNLPEADEAIVLSLENPVNARLGNSSARTIILTDDNDAALNVLNATGTGNPVTEGPEGTALAFRVTLARAGDGPVSVRYSFSGTATPGADFTGPEGMLTFTGTEREKTVSVTVLDDVVFEPEETVILTLSAPSGGVISEGTAAGTILENDPLPVITVSDAGVTSDAGPGAGRAVFAVQSSGPSASAVTLPWTLAGGSARAGEDFIGGSGVLTLAPGTTSARIEARIITDTLTEGAESFFLQPGSPEGAVLPGSGERWFLNRTLSTVTETGAGYGQSSVMQEDVLAVSAPAGNGGKGEVVVFSRTLSGWAPQARLSLPDGVAGDQFGQSIALWGDWLLIGAPGRDGAASHCGAAYIFRRGGGGWSLIQRLDAPGGRQNDYFGWAVSIYKSTLAVSSRLRSTGKGPRGNEGAVYVYDLADGRWLLSGEITADDTAAQSLGASLALYGDTLAAGAPDDDTIREDAGAVYIFERNAGAGSAWRQVRKFQNGSGPVKFQRFGGALSLWGKTLAAGSAAGSAVNIFDKNAGGDWENTAILRWNQTIPAGSFGSSLHLSGNVLAVGSPKAAGVSGKANVYFYQRNDPREWTQLQQPDDPAAVPGGRLGAGMAGWGGEFAVSGVEGIHGNTYLLRDTWGTAYIDDGPPASRALLQRAGGEFVLTWEPVPGALRYAVEGSDDLLHWQNLADVYPPSTSWSVPVSPGTRLYFRIRSHY
ncbi:MAG: Calx-beta domain-containing protein [Verrucomicrobiota bacterium]